MTTYSIAHTNFVFPRENLYDELVQAELSKAKQDGLRVTCQCGQSPEQELSIQGQHPRLYLSRRHADAANHSDKCVHGKASANVVAARGYSANAIERTADGYLQMDLGSLLLGGPAAEEPEESEEIFSDGNGGAPPAPSLRATVSLLGTLSWLLELAGLHRRGAASHETNPLSKLDAAARSVRPAGDHGPWGLSDYLLLQDTTRFPRVAANSKRLAIAHEKRRAVLFACVLSGRNDELSGSDLDLGALLGVPLTLPSGIMRKALRRHRLAAKRLKAGQAVLVFGRAHLRSRDVSADVSEVDYEALADRVALMSVWQPGMTPIADGREMARFKRAQDKGIAFEARLPFDRR